MSLLEGAMVSCVLMEKKRTPDGEGGFFVSWAEGAPFKAAITLDTSMQARIAEHQGVTNIYTVSTRKNVTLNYPDVFRRLSDGKIFRVQSDGDDNHTPKSAGLDMRVTTAEEYTLPNE